ncbi:MAG: site-specific DNA-methyltransferase, partial [Bacteroidales bacterium]|nr:site-specific DNA-methyltransferase [Bacteroidales bacterium]
QLRIRVLEKEVARLHTQIKKERYGLVWLDVPEGFERESENQIPVLEEVKDKAIKNDDGKPTHIIIEGDNYHALTCLNYTHKGKIDVIYIDPPYNTGSDGFTYKDKRFLKEFPDGSPVPKDHPLRHSYWLSFMSKRLELAKNLLSNKGVIFISIDDNEQANCKLLCDKIFGEENFICSFVWKSKSGGANDSKYVAVDHEYIICYAKKADKVTKMNDKYAEVTTSYNFKDEKGEYALDRLDKQSIRYSDSLNYEIIGPDGKSYWPKHKDPKNPNATWRWSKEHVQNNMNELVFKNGCIYTKNYKKETNIARSILYEERFGRTRTGKTDFYDLFQNELFTAPKPVKLLYHFFTISTSSNAVILDFFAGSGTTLHATMKLNAEDGGNRQCILVQQKEGDKNICESVTYERNKRVINGYTNAKGETIPGLGNSLKYYRTAFVGKNTPRRATDYDYDKTELSKKAGCLLALAENTLEEIEASNSFQIFSDGKKRYTGVYFTGRLSEIQAFTQKLETLRNKNRRIRITAYFFCWGDCAQFEDEFESLERISIQPIPKPILDIYQSINR